ncbi:hypothetical protein CDO73_01715 [Saccharibacillus sp. O23]|uniref:hypothetical protein n=1 Tax=Saccharibacillus sp. O23 TaxID=2009338 RepID=UPI000B4E4D4C|nr:hypothetical protein [Saccharibacillus sp. O23]OWR32352.1 hypothetical protein CDO73_01715 [Saccharibacillus sp. O23]
MPKALIPAVIAPTLIIWLIVLLQSTADKPLGNHPLSDSQMWIGGIVLGIVLPLLILTVRGKIAVDEEFLTLSLSPFFRKKVKLSDIAYIGEIASNPLRDLQNWGVKYRHRTWRFVLQGDQALELRLVNGQKIVMTCAHREELLEAMQQKKA